MKRFFVTIVALLCLGLGAWAQSVKFSGNARPVWSEIPEKNTGLDKIYVLYDVRGVSMSYVASNANVAVKWYKYGAQGGGYAEEITLVSKVGSETSISQVEGNCGYIIEEGDCRTYVWVVDYSQYYLTLLSVEPSDIQDCGSVALNVTGGGNDIGYTTITGVSRKLSRDIEFVYNNLEWDGDGNQWKDVEVVEHYEGFKPLIYEIAPLCNTSFTLSGDRFLKFWGEEVTITFDGYIPHSIDAQTEATQAERDVPNEKKEGDSGVFGGSAPVDITFVAYPTDAVVQREWQVSRDPEFNSIERIYNEDVLQELLTETGTFFYRYICSNADGSCEAMGETYTVTVGESSLICPNVFSPEGTPGVNDEWKVQYKSIVSFKCCIFNKWGAQICELNNPSQGWDGKYRGKYVGSGVYYYVIQAKGADGKEYKLKGDINIIKYKENKTNMGNSQEGVVM